MPFAFTILRNFVMLTVTVMMIVASFLQPQKQSKELFILEKDFQNLRAAIVYQHDPVTINAQLYSLENSLKEIIPQDLASRSVGRIYQKLNEGDDKNAVKILNVLQGQVRRKAFIMNRL